MRLCLHVLALVTHRCNCVMQKLDSPCDSVPEFRLQRTFILAPEVENVGIENVEPEYAVNRNTETQLCGKKFDGNQYVVPVTWERRLRSKTENLTCLPTMEANGYENYFRSVHLNNLAGSHFQVEEKKKARTFDCPQCRKTFNSKTGVLNHLRVHDVVRTYTCALCHAAFGNNIQLLSHKRCHEGEDRFFLCKTCKEAFTDHYDYVVHEISHTNRGLYKCIECAEYHGPDTIMEHVHTHYEKRSRSKAILKDWTRRRALRRNQTEKTRIECEECGKVWQSEDRYKEHMNRHIGLKPHQCLYCGKGFATVDEVLVHTRIHTKELPYVCDVCDSGLIDVASLKSHRLTHEDTRCHVKPIRDKDKPKRKYVLKKMPKEKPGVLFCPLCNKSCPNKKCLQIHLSYTHNDEADFVCDLCDRRFKDKLNLKRHFRAKCHMRKEFGMEQQKKKELSNTDCN